MKKLSLGVGLYIAIDNDQDGLMKLVFQNEVSQVGQLLDKRMLPNTSGAVLIELVPGLKRSRHRTVAPQSHRLIHVWCLTKRQAGVHS